MGSGNVNTGEFETFDQDNLAFSDLHQAALASGSIPAVFPPQHFKDMVLMDGGTIYNINIISAVQQCLEIVDDYSKIILDVAICAKDKETGMEVQRDALANYLHAWMIKRHGEGLDAIQWQKAAFPEVNYRYLFY